MADKQNEVAVAQPAPSSTVGFAPTEENIQLLKTTLADSKTQLSDNELSLFLYQAKRTGLDPLARQIYVLKKADRISFMTSIDGQRLVAQRTGEYQGQTKPEWCGTDGRWKDVWLSNDPPAAARIGVYRQGMVEPVYGVARWQSYNQGVGAWRSHPDVMLAKCAEALALRKAFPQELSDIYTAEEISEHDNQQARPLTIADALKQAAKLLGDAGVDSRDDKLAIIMGIAEVEDINQLTGSKMKTVLAAIRTENIGALRTMYLSGDDEVVEGELIDDEPNATVITPEPLTADSIDVAKPLDDQIDEANMDLVALAARKGEQTATWVVPEFKPSKMARPEQRTLIVKWLDHLNMDHPEEAALFVANTLGKDTVTTNLEAMEVLRALAERLNQLADEQKEAA